MTLRKFSTSSISTGTKSSKLWDGETFPGYFESIATVVVGSSGAANVEFTSIAADWTHLQVRALVRTDRSDYQDTVATQFNGDTGSNYSFHYVVGNGSAASANAGASQSYAWGGLIAGGSNAASTFGTFVMDVLDYRNSNKNKTIRTLSGTNNNDAGNGRMLLMSSAWYNTNAITSIKLYPAFGTNFSQYSHFALYGIRSA